jgi:hypothetical protein
MEKSPAYYDLLEAFVQSGCAVCRLTPREVAQYLDSLLYEYVTEGDIQQALRDSRGLCNAHGWQLTEYTGNALGITILYRAALDEVVKLLAQLPEKPSASRLKRLLNGQASDAAALAARLMPARPCLACERQTEAATRYITMLVDYMGDARFRQAYEASSGLCLAHLRDVLHHTPDQYTDIFITTQQRLWTALRHELQTFIDRDSALSDEVIGTEGTSRLRAIAALSGLKSDET